MSDATPAQYYPGHLDWMERFFSPRKQKIITKELKLVRNSFSSDEEVGVGGTRRKISALPSWNGTQLVSFCGPGEKLQ